LRCQRLSYPSAERGPVGHAHPEPAACGGHSRTCWWALDSSAARGPAARPVRGQAYSMDALLDTGWSFNSRNTLLGLDCLIRYFRGALARFDAYSLRTATGTWHRPRLPWPARATDAPRYALVGTQPQVTLPSCCSCLQIFQCFSQLQFTASSLRQSQAYACLRSRFSLLTARGWPRSRRARGNGR